VAFGWRIRVTSGFWTLTTDLETSSRRACCYASMVHMNVLIETVPFVGDFVEARDRRWLVEGRCLFADGRLVVSMSFLTTMLKVRS
jgi:hypothetical protein